MNVKTAIIIAGGFGTRLQNVVKDLPKPMAPINGKPFLEILINHLSKQGIKNFVLAIGYKADIIKTHFSKQTNISYSVETEPLGTGGCVKKALNLLSDKSVLVLNGDSFFDVDIQLLYKEHVKHNADMTLALKRIPNSGRYGTVKMDGDGKIIGFEEKSGVSTGLISAGVYILNKNIFDKEPEKFSIEKDFMAVNFNKLKFYGYPSDGYFIDIGIPEDYAKAQTEL